MNSPLQDNTPQSQFSTQDKKYTDRLLQKTTVWWKRLLDVQRPYRWNLNRLKPGFILDIGCGIGRNLTHLKGNGIGIDHNLTSVEIAKQRGLQVFVTEEFHKSKFFSPNTFDSILLSHVAEHMKEGEAVDLLKTYLPLLKPNGKIIIITPQELGYGSDQTHVQFVDFETDSRIIKGIGCKVLKLYSFPFPRIIGRIFKYNEFICVGEKS